MEINMKFESSKQLQATETENRLNHIHEWHKANPGATIQQAMTFIPESEYMVKKYRKNIAMKFTPRLYIDVLGEDFED